MTILTEKLTRLLPSFVTRTLLMVFAAIILAGCASTTEDQEQLPESLSEAELYQLSSKAIDDGRYSEAIKSLRTLESRYPFGAFAEQAQLDIIYAYFKNAEPEASKAAADRFIRLHPQHPDADYAYYMKGLASNTASMGLLERYLPMDLTRRDPGQARVSFNEFSELLSRYPESKYVPDARQRMVALRNRLAEYEIHAANYYLKRKAYVAAVNRGRYVVENMQQTPAVPEALAIMVEGYQHLELPKPASEALEVLRLNYPNHPALDKNGNFVGYKVFEDVDPSIWSTLTFGLIGSSKPKVRNAPPPQPPMVN
ncbi:outer membrane protein assembly factor BamD [Endozoicomonas sp. SCSIO W0465]|uniref:outer membrane protein assembly factor BamD n=1 Tax=Endozoicomonas sp. SCSIO W0465 TaxID=2918516 RepID=UPI002075680A|nr:outer membrane protein assembly factor BamD [Endozoicomonas sp. SCSIO W0465]USE34863.1 outer membrane protein assembly factor BamD [Endozoicomonas sp. SCSIO W0465]